jgi:hypothetical protein
MEAEYLRLKMLANALTQFIENQQDFLENCGDASQEEKDELELAEAELENINMRLEAGLI